MERAITFIAEGVLEGKQENLSTTDGKPKLKLLKVLNKQTSRETTAPFQFSSTNWSGDTAAYRESVQSREPAFVQAVFSEAHALKTNIKVESGSGMVGKSGPVNPRTLLCKSPFFVTPNYLIYLACFVCPVTGFTTHCWCWLLSKRFVTLSLPFLRFLSVSLSITSVSPPGQ